MKEESSNASIAHGISEASFFKLLKDKIFVDYFSVFLTLPVFEQRLLYKSLTDEFEFDPPVKSAVPKVQVDRTRTLNWLYTVRLPLFLKTNLYMEYKLCRKLIASESPKSSDANQQFLGCGNLADRFEDAVGHVTGMRQFRQYLDGGPGSKLMNLWLDIERFFSVPATDLLTRWTIFREIQVTFYDFENCATDWQTMSGQIPCVLIDGRRFVEVEDFPVVANPTMSQKEVNAFISDTYSDQKQQEQLSSAEGIGLSGLRTLQRLLLRILRDYWLNKWILHRQTAEWLQSSSKDREAEEEEEEGKEGKEEVEKEERDQRDDKTPVEQVKNELETMVKGWPAKKSPGSEVATGYVVDDTFLFSPEANEVITIQDDGTVILSPIDPLVSSQVTMTSSVQRVMNTYLSNKDATDETEYPAMSDSHSYVSLGLRASDSSLSESCVSIASSVSSIFADKVQLPPVSTAARKSMTLSGTKERQKDVLADPSHQMRRNIVELRRLNSTCPELSSFTLRRLSKTSSSTHSSETAAIICRKPSQPLLAIEPGASTTDGYRDDQRSFLRGIVADRLSGGPFEAYLVTQGCDEARRILNFWRDAQVYLSCKGLGDTSVQAYMRCRRAKVLVMRYLTGHSDKRMCVLAPALRYSLQRHLAIGKGDELMRRAQDVAIEFLRPMWQSYLQSDMIVFQNAVVAVRREVCGFTLKQKSDATGPNYFQDQEYIDKQKKSDSEDPVMVERARSYEAARRTELALQYAIDTSEFCFDNLLLDTYPESEIRIFPDLDYGSLAVKKFRIVTRPDILLEQRRKKFLDQLAYMRIPSTGEEYDDDLQSIHSAMRPFMMGSKLITRPDRPDSCDSIFADPIHLEFFQRYLVAIKAGITPILFYLDVDKLRETKNPVRQKEKMQEILNKYFRTVDDVKKLKCDSRVLETIHYLPKQTNPEMLSIAQSAVRRCLVDRWCEKYMKTFDDEAKARADERKNATYDLWKTFLKGVNKLRNGLLDEETLHEFENFVLKETAKDIAAGKTYDMKAFVTKETRTVRLENVINDIRFMRDIELYRILCDQVKRLKRRGESVEEEEEQVIAEGVRIYDNYIGPGSKLNICAQVTISVAQKVERGSIGRDLFHDAVIELYPVVDLWWRKFIDSKGRIENFWDKIGAIIQEKRRKKARKKFSSDSLDRDGSILRRKAAKGGRQAGAKQTDVFNMKQTLSFDDDRVHIVFSILNGLRLFLPRSLKSESKDAKQLMPGVYQLFYELPSVRTRGQAPDGHYDALQLRRKQTFMTSKESKSFPIFVIGGTTYVLIHSFDPKHMHQAFSKTIQRVGHA